MKTFSPLLLIAFAMALLSGPAQAQRVIARWNLGENDPGAAAGVRGADVTRDRVGPRHLTRFGNPTNSGAVPAGSSTLSMRFNGSDAFYQTNFAGLWTDVPLENFILSCDVNIASQPAFSFPVAIGRNGGGLALLQEGGNWKIIHQGVAASPPGAPIQLNTWTHLDLVRSNGVSYLHVNGALNLTFNSTPNTPANFLTIGANQRASDTAGDVEGRFPGLIDNVVIIDPSLPPLPTVVADVGADFRPTTPKAGWAYLGSTAPSGGSESALTYGGAVGNNGNIGYGGGANTFNLGAVLGTNTGANAFKIFVDGQFNAGVPGTDLLVHPGDPVQLNGGGKPFTILRYTLSAEDLASGNLALITGSFRELIPGGDGIEGYVFRNATELFHVVASSDTLSQTAGTFNVRALVSAGDTISFVVGIKGNLFADESAVRGTITMTMDSTPPALIGPPMQVDTTRLAITFDEPVEATLGNFALNNGASVTSVTPGAAANSFDLVTTALTAGQTYSLTISGVTDLSANALNTNVSFTATDFSPNLLAYLRPPTEPIGPATRRGGFVISEIMFHPTNNPAFTNLEFVEIYNSQPWAEEIGGYRLTGEYDFTFPAAMTVPAGGFIIVAAVPAQVTAAYGVGNVLGGFTNRLNNAGGTLRLRNDANAVVFEVDYDSQPPWPAAADGAGHSLVLARPSYGMNDPRSWAASANLGGSPGAAEPAAVTNLPVVINEFLANGDTDPDFIELFNLSSQAVTLDGCLLSDDAGTNKFVIPPGTTIAPRGYLVFAEAQLGFSLSAGGETVWFRDATGRVLDAARFDGQQRGVSTGRTPDGASLFSRLSTRTPGTTNSPALHPDVVINELFYAPPSGNGDDEFIELKNRTTNAVDLSGWRLRGGVSFNLPSGTTIPADGYLVIAKDANRLRTNHPGLSAASVVGNFSGNLANDGERVSLLAPELNGTNTIHYVIAETTYAIGGRWGRWSDAGGSSLELIDADADPRFASNWADSDSCTNSAWKTIEFTGTVDNGQGTPDRLQVFLQGAGECLVDDIEVLLAGNAVNRIANGSFESGTNGWTFQGTHRLSTVDNAGGFSGPRALHLRATGRGDTGPNKAQTALTTVFNANQTATIRAKVRWLAGHPEILFRLRGSWLEAYGNTRTTSSFGTPGRANSRAVGNAGPAIADVTHLPVLPAAFAPVTVYARVTDPHGVGSVQLRYRLDPSASVNTVEMESIGAGVYAGRIPGQGSGTLAAFSIAATDALGTQSIFPKDAPAQECLVRWGESLPGGAIGTYRFWFTRTNRTIWETREPQSNETLDTTFVYGDWRVIYNAGVMYSGSPFHTPLNTGPMGVPCDYQLAMPADDAFLGETDIILSPPGSPWGTDLSILDYTMVREQMIWWIARQIGVPSLHRRFVRVFVNGQPRTTIFEDTQQPAGEFIREWFPGETGGDLFKAQDWLEFPDTGNSFLSDIRATLEKFVTTGGALPPKRYRWIWAPRAVNGSVHDFTNLFTLVETMALADTNLFTTQVEALIDIESWFRAMAVQRIAGNWDTWGWTFGKNMYAYKPPGERWAMMPWDIDFSFGLNSSATDADVMINGNGGSQPGDPIATKLRNQPQLQRAYWRAFEDAVNGAMEDSRVSARIDLLQAALTANGFAPAAPAPVKSWISARRTYLRSQLTTRTNAAFAITSNAGNDFTINQSAVRISGTAPVAARTILFNGAAYPVSWTGVTTWTALVPLVPGANPIVVTALDVRGNALTNFNDTITITSSATPQTPEGSVVINEIHYNPAVPDTAFVELFNSSTNTFDLSGWRLDGVDFTFPPGSILTNRQLLVIAADRYALGHTFGAGTVVAGDFNARLDNDGEVLSLLKPTGTNTPPIVVDRVRYESVAPWSTNANGTGPSLQLTDASQDNARVSNWTDGSGWRFFSLTTNIGGSRLSIFFSDAIGGDVYLDDLSLVPGSVPGAGVNAIANGDFESPLAPTWLATGIATNSHLTNGLARSGARSLHYVQGTGGAGLTLFYQELSPAVVTNTPYTLSGWYLPGTGSTNLNLRAVSTAFQARPSLRASAPTPGAVNLTVAPIPVYPTLWLNEVLPLNTGGPADAAGDRDPWVELHNAGPTPVSLDGMFLSDRYLSLGHWAFPSNLTIAPGGFVVVWCDDESSETTPTELHANFRLAADAGSIVLSRTVDGAPQILDYFNYTAVPANQSYGSVPEGQPFYRGVMFSPTPGATNDNRSAPIVVFINEWMAANTSASGIADPADGNYQDWFELFNPGPNAVDLGGHFLTDNLSNRFQFEIPRNGRYVLPPSGHLLVWADNEPGQNSTNRADLHVNFSLRAAGEAIGLFAADGTQIDAVTFTNQLDNVSAGRSPDGSGTILALPTPSPRASNGDNSAPAPQLGQLQFVGSSQVQFTIRTVAGRRYQVVYKDDLSAASWQLLGGPRTAAGPTLLVTDTPPRLQRFYQATLLP